MGDRRAAGEPERGAHLAGDDHRQRGLAQPGRPGEQHVVGGAAARLGGLEHQAELLAHALLADDLGQAAGPQRRLHRPLVDVGVGGGEPGQVGLLRGLEVRPRQAFRSVSSAARSRAPTSGVGSGLGRRPRRRPGRPPSPTSRGRPGPAGPGPATARPRRVRRCGVAAVPTGAPSRSLELEDDPLRALLPDAGDPGQRLDVLGGHRGPQVVGGEHGEHRLGQLGADAGGGLEQLEAGLLVVVEEAEQGQRVLADDHAGRQRRLVPGAQGGQRVGGAHRARGPTPPTSRTALLRVTPATVPRTNAITDLPAFAQGGVDAGLGTAAPDVGDGQRQRVGGVGRLGRLGRAAAAGSPSPRPGPCRRGRCRRPRP